MVCFQYYMSMFSIFYAMFLKTFPMFSAFYSMFSLYYSTLNSLYINYLRSRNIHLQINFKNIQNIQLHTTSTKTHITTTKEARTFSYIPRSYQSLLFPDSLLISNNVQSLTFSPAKFVYFFFFSNAFAFSWQSLQQLSYHAYIPYYDTMDVSNFSWSVFLLIMSKSTH